MISIVDSTKLARTKVSGEDDQTVRWAGAFAAFGGHGATASSTIVYEIEPGHRLGWHTDATEETQYIISGTGMLHLEDGSSHAVGPGSVFVLPTPMRHDLANTGKETLRAVAFASEVACARHAQPRGRSRVLRGERPSPAGERPSPAHWRAPASPQRGEANVPKYPCAA